MPHSDLNTQTGLRLSPGWRLGLVGVLAVIACACFVLLFIRGSTDFALPRRFSMLGAMIIAAFCQGVATVVFHTITHNRILTPSIMGFDSLYVLMQTLLVAFFGGGVLAATDGVTKLVVQTVIMVLMATLLYRWLFSGRFANLQVLLLVGVVLGLAFNSVSTFVQRLLSPSNYELLSARLFGRLGAADTEAFPLAFASCLIIAIILWRRRHVLDVLSLGRSTATALGVNVPREITLMLVLIAVMVAFSTALLGPMTFFGFVVALLSYQFAGSHRHAYTLPMAMLTGILTLVGAQFIVDHVFHAAGMVTIVIEFVGGILFLVVLLRKGAL